MKVWEQVKKLEEMLETTQDDNIMLQEKLEMFDERNKTDTDQFKDCLKRYLSKYSDEEIKIAIKVLWQIPVGYFNNQDIQQLLTDLESLRDKENEKD